MSTIHEASPGEAITAAPMPRTYEVRTFGCQMNVHDSERLSGSLEAAGYVPADGAEPDVVVINTCAVRENADNKLYGNLGHLAGVKRRHEGMQIAVGGCLAQKDKNVILEKAPWVDVVFGTHNMGSLPSLLERARHNDEAQLEILDALEVFPSTLPTKRDSSYSGWVSISVGCNNTCTFCIVPALRGKEKDRRPGDILAEIQALVDDGAIEVTLLGQNVNSYGVEFGDRQAFGKLLRAAGEIEGLERIRFTSPHPAAFTDDVIDAMAETPAVMPQLHMPLQSGSDRILKAMRRSYRSEKFLGILDRVRERIPNAAISTDIIVGFPGETEEDFQETLRVVEAGPLRLRVHVPVLDPPRHPGGDDGRPGAEGRRAGALRATHRAAGADLAGRRTSSSSADRSRCSSSTGEGKKDAETHRLSGRAEDSRLVHFEVPGGSASCRARATSSPSSVTQAAPFHLLADSLDGAPLRVRRTRAGDAWDRTQAESCARAGGPAAPRHPPAVPSRSACRPCAWAAPAHGAGVGTMPIYDPTDGQR